ncbi:MAG: hypothetical protein AAB759_02910 [Patescibacteria group bacterium]|mgnify:FL=1
MMRRFLMAVLVLAFLVAGSVAFAAPLAEKAIPDGVRLGSYPEFSRPLTIGEQADFGLHPVRLSEPWTGYNFHRKVEGGRYVLETLATGTLVLADESGNPIYKADCGNRLGSLPVCPACPATSAAGGGTLPETFSDAPLQSRWAGFWHGVGALAKALGWLILALLGLALLAAIIIAGGAALRSLWRSTRGSCSPPAPAPTTTVTPPAVVPAERASATLPLPAPPLAPPAPSVSFTIGPSRVFLPAGASVETERDGRMTIFIGGAALRIKPLPRVRRRRPDATPSA